MKKSLGLLSLLIVTAICANAQNFHLDVFAGTSNYQGDLQDKRFTFNQAHFAGGIGFSYDLTDHFTIRTGINFGTVSGDDKQGKNQARNLNFTSKIFEGNVNALYYITPLADHVLTPYVFAGLAAYHFNPYTHDSTGKKYYLQPLSTEGEGFIQGRNNYSLTQFAIPFGAGVKMPISNNINVGLEVGLRKLFTDYLDDVSTTYVDESLLLANRGATAVELAYRGGELKTGSPVYPPAGEQRGSPKNKDWYYFTGLTISIGLGNGNGGFGGHRRSEYGCPVNVR
jgi:Domain of unknown function (DUF6089)